jgi:hypothetical protein
LDVALKLDEYAPLGHCKHSWESTTPNPVEYVPPTQARQAPDVWAPVLINQVPALHKVHADTPCPVEKVPLRQSVQTALAVVVQTEALNFPAVQVVQGEHVVIPAEDEKAPAAHWAHAPDVCMPVPVLNVPARQLVQEAVPTDRQGP